MSSKIESMGGPGREGHTPITKIGSERKHPFIVRRLTHGNNALATDVASSEKTRTPLKVVRATDYPHWQDTANALQDPQRETAEKVAFKGVVEAGIVGAHHIVDRHPEGLRGSVRKEHISREHEQTAVALIHALHTGEEPTREDFREEADSLSPLVLAQRNRTYSRAQNWSEADMRREQRRIRTFMRSLPPELQTVMQAETDLDPETRNERITRLVKGGLINAGYQFGKEWGFQLAGAAAFAADPIARVHASSGEVLGGSYVLWGAGLGLAMVENWKRLEDRGNSPSVISLAQYEHSKIVNPDNKAMQVARTAAGYLTWDAGNEAVYYGLAGLGLAASQSDTRTAAYLAAANAAAGIVELGQAGISRLLRREKAVPPTIVFDSTSEGIKE